MIYDETIQNSVDGDNAQSASIKTGKTVTYSTSRPEGKQETEKQRGERPNTLPKFERQHGKDKLDHEGHEQPGRKSRRDRTL